MKYLLYLFIVGMCLDLKSFAFIVSITSVLTIKCPMWHTCSQFCVCQIHKCEKSFFAVFWICFLSQDLGVVSNRFVIWIFYYSHSSTSHDVVMKKH